MKRLLALAPATLVALAAVALIFYQWAAALPFWVDEEMIAINIRDRSISELSGRLWLGQSAPLGWLVLQRLILLTAGGGEQALRFVPALFGAGTIAAAWWAGRRWMTAAGAFVFTLLVGFGLWISSFPLELKHYSADAFWGLMLPACAAWALEGGGAAGVRRRAMAWWALAAAAHWLSNGGLLATPGCALVLCALVWRRHGIREAAIFAAAGGAWLLSFAVYYALSLSHTHGNEYLRGHWSREFLPPGLGLAGSLRWLGARLEPLALNPAGTAFWALFWMSSLAGLALARTRALGMMFMMLPLTAFLLAAAGLVPLYERFTLWMAPALYAGIAMLADRAVLLARAGVRSRRILLVPAAALGAALIFLAFDITARGLDDFRQRRSLPTKHGLDDRSAVQWLLAQQKPGDALLSTRLGWPALWWYGELRPDGDPGGAGYYEVNHRAPGDGCRPEDLRDGMRRHARALVHIGFPDLHEGYGRLLLRHLDHLGAIVYYREFGQDGFAAVIALHTANPEESSLDLIPATRPEPRRLAGCIAISPARVW